MFSHASPLALALLFTLAAAVTWWAGVRITIAADVLSDRYHLGQALGGQIFLAIVVSLPEVAIVVAASLSGAFGIAIGNVLGGVALQTVVLVLLDAVAVHERPLTFAGADLVLVLQGTFVAGILAVTLMGMPLRPVVFVHATPIGLAIVGTWILGLVAINRARHGLPWTDHGVPSDLVEKNRADIRPKEERARERAAERPPWAVWFIFLGAGALTLAGGVVLEQSGQRLATFAHLTGVVFGATVLAAVTALPDVSTGLEAIRLGAYQLAFADIFGSNAFLPVLLPLITLIAGRDPLPIAGGTNTYLCALGILLTVIYVGGLVFRPQREFLRLGPDSWSVLVIYILGIAGLTLVR